MVHPVLVTQMTTATLFIRGCNEQIFKLYL
jgi:hypothetical protein